MIYQCLVVDNSNFYKNGTIRLRIKDLEFNPLLTMQDMAFDPARSIQEYGNESELYGYSDIDAFLYTPYGGAYDFGLFTLPQPNTVGLVAKLGNSYDADDYPEYVYLGGLSKFEESIGTIKMPSDSLHTSNGCDNFETKNEDPFNGIVLKQKRTYIGKDDDGNSTSEITDSTKETLNWEKRPTQNLVVLDNAKIKISHNIMDEDEALIGQADFTINKDGINISYLNTDTKNESIINLDHKGNFKVSNMNSEDKITNSISADENGMSIYHQNQKNEASIMMGKNYSGKSVISANIKSPSKSVPSEISISEDGIDITSSGNVSINPGNGGTVSLGSGQGYVVTSLRSGAIEVGNVTFVASKNVIA